MNIKEITMKKFPSEKFRSVFKSVSHKIYPSGEYQANLIVNVT